MAENKVFAFTGISGTAVRSCLKLLKREAFPEARIVSIDDHLWRVFREHAAQNPGIAKEVDLGEEFLQPDSPPNWWLFLRLPIGRIRHYWRLAAEKALEEVSEEEASVTFVTFHACYQGDDYRWRLSAVDPSLLIPFRIQSYFCLIDDIYDIQLRREDDLRAERMLCGNVKGDSWVRLLKLLERTVTRLSEIVLWRQEEIMLSDLFASACGVRAHVLATKHPIRTFARVIQDPDWVFYFSHPITSVRLDPAFPDTEGFRIVQRASDDIRALATLIEPTTIDELRFKSRKPSEGEPGVVVPELAPRWPLLMDEKDLVFKSPAEQWGSEEFVCPYRNVVELGLTEALRETAAGGGPTEAQRAIASMVSSLQGRIAADITWRDHHLVDQTAKLIVYRPFFHGTRSGGVAREVEYLAKLARTGGNVEASVLYHPDEDERALSLTVARELLRRWLGDQEVGLAIHVGQQEELEAALVQNIAERVRFGEEAGKVAATVVSELEKVHSLEPPIGESSAMAAGEIVTSIERARKVRVRAVEIARSALISYHYLQSLGTDDKVKITLTNNYGVFMKEVQELALVPWTELRERRRE